MQIIFIVVNILKLGYLTFQKMGRYVTGNVAQWNFQLQNYLFVNFTGLAEQTEVLK
jgi:hypothetical protein